MERDLSKVRQKRAEREHQMGKVAALYFPNTQSSSGKLMEHATTGFLNNKSGIEGNEEDAVMADAVEQMTDESKGDEGAKEPKSMDQEPAVIALDGMPQDSQNSTGLAISIPQNGKPDDAEALANAKKGPTHGLQPEVGTLAGPNGASEAAASDGFDFDSMFNDAELVAPDGSINFDLDFSNNGNDTQELMGDNATENATMSNTDIPNTLPTTSEDLNSLLPGLENYVNDATGEAPIDNSAVNTTNKPEADQETTAETTNAAPQAATEAALIDSSFDDLFDTADFSAPEGNGNNEDVVGEGNFGGFEEFNDDWFKM